MTNIPNELKSLPQWVGFLATTADNGKTTKKPVNPHTLSGASSTDSTTWGTYQQAVNSVGQRCRVGGDSGTVTGIGFVFRPPYCGIDIDHCIDLNSGEVNQQALAIVALMDSYTELSPSGTGLHILYKGTIHDDWKRKKTSALGKGVDLEMYQQGRYFTVTGKVFNGHNTVNDREEQAAKVQETYMQTVKKQPSATKQTAMASISLSDRELLDKAMNAANGMQFARLYSGDTSAYDGDESRADMALCSLLAFWCQRNTDRMDRLFRQSGLMRDKWDRRQSGTTYGAITLQKAADECAEVYTPKKSENFSVTIEHHKEITKTYTLDDTGNAQRMADMYKDAVGYNYTDKRWMLYDSGKWIYDPMGYIYNFIDKSVEQMAKEKDIYIKMDKDSDDGNQTMEKAFEKHLKRSRSHTGKKNIEQEVQHYVALSHVVFDRNRELLNTASGVIDLTDFSLRDSTPKDYFTKSIAAHYDVSAKCPLWEKFLHEIFANDADMIRYIQKAVGYSLTGSTQEQCAFLLIGDGCNGKSTFLDIIRQLFGDYASNIQAESLMIRNNNNGINSDIARLRGARLVTSAEPNEGLRLNEGLIKQLTGGDIVTARKLYGDEFEFKPEFKLWMAANHKPVIRGNDHGIWRRMHIVPFSVQIPKEKIDKTLTDKLLTELDGIFQWALAGLRLYQSEGLELPEMVSAATAEYRMEMDVVARFLEECTENSFAGMVRASDLYQTFALWAKNNNEYPMSNTKFGKEVITKYERIKRKDGWYYCGIVLNGASTQYTVSIGNNT
ncbi:MAG: DNA primase [Clostridia bacterium]|nr:DNA primase [Clostridia bacterium]